MNKKKMFGISAVFLMISIAFMPVTNSLEIQKINENEARPSTIEYDYGVWFNRCEYIRHNWNNKKALYEIDWEFGHNGWGYEGGYKIFIKIGESVIDSFTVYLPCTPPGEPWIEEGTYSLWLETSDIPKDDEELLFAGSEVALEIDINDIEPSNNVDFQLAKYWKDDDKYEPVLSHLIKTLPINNWIEETKIFESQDGTIIKIPFFRGIYKGIILPLIIGSNRFGWIGDFVQLLFIDFGIALCDFLKEFLDVAACIVLILGEISIAIQAIISTLSSLATGQLEISAVFVSEFLLSLGALATTFKSLLINIDQLPIDPDDPLRIALDAAATACWEFLYSRPWLDDVTIKGTVDRCKAGEQVTINCRNIENREIPGGAGMRTIEPFGANTSWNKDYKDLLFFRNCQVTIEGDKHNNLILESPKLLSYCAPQGTLKIVSSFKNSRTRSLSDIITRFLENFPMLARLFQILKAQPTLV